jgi:DNA-binding MarR family transcriptional regulator
MTRKDHKTFLVFNVPPQVEANYVLNLWKVFAQSMYVTSQKLAPLKIATRHYVAMAVLASSKDFASQSTLVQCMGLSPNVVLTMVDYLDELGYTRRVQNPRNRRENIVLLSKKGRVAYDSAVVLLQQAEQEILAPLSGQESEQYQNATRKLSAYVPPH